MIWDCKGHQFDKFIENWSSEKEYYVWGAGNSGKLFYNLFKDKIKIVGFIDSDLLKENLKIGNCNIYLPKDIVIGDEKKKILVTSGFYNEIALKLSCLGYKENEDFCDIKIFREVFFMYNYNKLYLYRTDVSITSRCTLKCEKCNMLMPYFNCPEHKSIENIKRDIDIYFEWIDHVEFMNLLGGEPFLHPRIVELLKYINENHSNRIDNLRFFTNGTCNLSDEILHLCKATNVYMEITDYTDNIPNLKKNVDGFEKKLNDYEINYKRTKIDKWLDFGYPEVNHVNYSKKQLINLFDKCKAPFRGLENGKLYYCHINTSAVNAGLFEHSNNDYFDMNNFDESKKMLLMEFDLGFSELGYITFCRRCNGCSEENLNYIEVAKQV